MTDYGAEYERDGAFLALSLAMFAGAKKVTLPSRLIPITSQIVDWVTGECVKALRTPLGVPRSTQWRYFRDTSGATWDYVQNEIRDKVNELWHQGPRPAWLEGLDIHGLAALALCRRLFQWPET